MELLFAPWRNEYTTDTAHTKQEDANASQCVFCEQFKQDNDQANFIVRRFEHTVVILNKYPYNAGHLLIIPTAHVGTLHELGSAVRAEMMELISESSRIVKEALKAEGVNIGTNLGKAAGAGIPSHVHAHVLPRWLGDTNFLPVFGETKQISFDLTQIYNQLKPHFDRLSL